MHTNSSEYEDLRSGVNSGVNAPGNLLVSYPDLIWIEIFHLSCEYASGVISTPSP